MSSFFRSIVIPGRAGSTGPTGPTGPDGFIGADGQSKYGITGSSITGITFTADNTLLFNFDDNSTQQSSYIKGITGLWQARISGTGEGNANSIFSSVGNNNSVNSNLETSGDFLTLKNFTTTTPETIGITLTPNGDNIIVDYYTPIQGISFSGSSVNKMVIGGIDNGYTSANGTKYNTTNTVLNIKIDSYLEGITNVYPATSFANDSQWDLYTDVYSIFQLKPDTTSGRDKYINIISTVSPNISKGITILIPDGITAELNTTTKFIINSDENLLCSFPMGMDIKLSNKLDVINLISKGKNKWYGNYALWNDDSSQKSITNKKNISDLISDNVAIISDDALARSHDNYIRAKNNCLIPGTADGQYFSRPCITLDVPFHLPIVDQVIPAFVSVDGGASVKLIGKYFSGVTGVYIGNFRQTNWTLGSGLSQDTEITIPRVTEHDAGDYDISIINPSGTGITTAAIQYGDFTTIYGITPSSGRSDGGTEITIRGGSFKQDSVVKFKYSNTEHDVPGALWVNSTKITAGTTFMVGRNLSDSPLYKATVIVRSQTSPQNTASLIDGFEYTGSNATITGIFPGYINPGATFNIIGTNLDYASAFSPTTSVYISGTGTPPQFCAIISQSPTSLTVQTLPTYINATSGGNSIVVRYKRPIPTTSQSVFVNSGITFN
jgi:hypothetical protein